MYRDDRTDEEMLNVALKAMSPLWLFSWYTGRQMRDRLSGDWICNQDISLSSRPTFLDEKEEPDAEAGMKEQALARQKMLEGSSAFQAALRRIEPAGVSHIWGETMDYGSTDCLLRFVIPPSAIPMLQEMAATDAGIVDPSERHAAAVAYRRYLYLQYDPDGPGGKVPVESPYHTLLNDFGSDPNPIKATGS